MIILSLQIVVKITTFHKNISHSDYHLHGEFFTFFSGVPLNLETRVSKLANQKIYNVGGDNTGRNSYR